LDICNWCSWYKFSVLIFAFIVIFTLSNSDGNVFSIIAKFFFVCLFVFSVTSMLDVEFYRLYNGFWARSLMPWFFRFSQKFSRFFCYFLPWFSTVPVDSYWLMLTCWCHCYKYRSMPQCLPQTVCRLFVRACSQLIACLVGWFYSRLGFYWKFYVPLLYGCRSKRCVQRLDSEMLRSKHWERNLTHWTNTRRIIPTTCRSYVSRSPPRKNRLPCFRLM